MLVPADGDFRLKDEDATGRLGAAVARALQAGEAICLWGPLGAGKTTLARGLIRRLAGAGEEVPSPTFTLAQVYPTNGLRVTHFDLYRIERADEAYEIGLDEALDEGAALIEWPDRLGGHLPADRLDIELSVIEAAGGEQRLARLTAHGAWEGRPIEFRA
jgi:tRNA threonylcarbamoyladenosine biosynthesis protein TsaE